MKKSISIIAILVIFFASFSSVFAQDKSKQTVTFKFKNNSILPRKYTIVSYSPDSDGNGTSGVMMTPSGTKEFKVLVGTKFYLADSKQVDIVMGGNKLTGTPFYVAKLEDDGKVINLENSYLSERKLQVNRLSKGRFTFQLIYNKP